MKKNGIAPKRLFFAVIVVLALVLSLSGCGTRQIGYGVVLWSDNEQALPTGSMVPILDQSTISNTYTVMTPAIAKSADTPAQKPRQTQVAMWRISFQKSKLEALKFQKAFSPYQSVYARSERNALPIRKEPTTTGDMVYKLRQGEVMKVLGRSEKPENESGLVAYWYRVVTETGVSGWVFGYLLTVYDQGTGQTPALAQTPQDPLVTLITGTIWRPTYFSQMIDSGQYDLSKFDPKYGFFPDPTQKRFNLVLPDYSIAFDYTDLQQMEQNRYQAVGTSLLITVRNGNELSIQYSYKDKIVSTVLERIDQNIQDLVTAELKRRDDLYKSFMNNGATLSSSAYGQIRLGQDKKFTWTGYESLVPNVFPSTSNGTGTVSFPYFLSDTLKNKFDGAITFTMTGTDATQPTSFLYSFANGGVRFEYVPASNIKDSVVQRESFSPLIIFFTASGPSS